MNWEFKISNSGEDHYIEAISKAARAEFFNDLHVIEYSAYEELREENEKLREQLRKILPEWSSCFRAWAEDHGLNAKFDDEALVKETKELLNDKS